MEKKTRCRTYLKVVVRRSKDTVNDQEFLDSAKSRPQDFTRRRKMPFNKLVLFMLNMIKSSTQACLDRFFDLIGVEDVHMTQQSFSEARQKIRWEAFQHLFKVIIDEIYSGYTDTWHGYRVSAIDGSKLQIPDDKALRDYFGTAGKGHTAATAQASALYDVFNNFLMDAQLEPMGIGERELALQHIEVLSKMESFDKELILFDRGYASLELLDALVLHGISYVMRIRRKFNVSIDQLSEGDHHIVLRHKDGRDIEIRVIKFTLTSGEEETLITDLTDKQMGMEDFKWLYGKRWPIETKYDEIKNKLEVENFSGRTYNAIMQDFFVTMYMSNIAAIACWDAQERADKAREMKDNKYDYQINVNHAIGTLKDRFILAVLEPRRSLRNYKVDRILYLIAETVVPSRPDRSFPRNPYPRKAKFRHNKKSNC